jgi:hypothetical protein
MNKSMKQIALLGMAAMAAIEGNAMPRLRPKPIIHKGEAKKCKSCKFFPCPESKTPMRIACGNHERRKRK